MIRTASFGGPGNCYRYRLGRDWSTADRPRRVCWVMLNPSTADELADDPTIRKCIGFSQRAGYEGLLVVNLFAFRSTDPKGLLQAADPVGPLNDQAILRAARECERVVCAWGNGGTLRGRAAHVRELLLDHGYLPHVLELNEKTGQPRHPLYVPYEKGWKVWRCE